MLSIIAMHLAFMHASLAFGAPSSPHYRVQYLVDALVPELMPVCNCDDFISADKLIGNLLLTRDVLTFWGKYKLAFSQVVLHLCLFVAAVKLLPLILMLEPRGLVHNFYSACNLQIRQGGAVLTGVLL